MNNPIHQMQCVRTTTVGHYSAEGELPGLTSEADQNKRLSSTPHLPHDHHQWQRLPKPLSSNVVCKQCTSADTAHLLCVFLWPFFTSTHRIPDKCRCFCIPCHSKGCDPWQTLCGAGVGTQGSSPLLHCSLPYRPCPYACLVPSLLQSSLSHQESLSTRERQENIISIQSWI